MAIDTWSTLANVLLCEGVRSALAERLNTINVVVALPEEYEDKELAVIGSSYDSKTNTVRLWVSAD